MSCPNINSSEFKKTESLIGKKNTYKLFMLTNDYVLDIQENDSPNTAIQKLKLKYNSNEFGNISDSNYQDLVNEINSYNSTNDRISIDQKEDGTYKLGIKGNIISKPNSNLQVQKNPLNTVERIQNNRPLRLPAEKLGFNQEFQEPHSKINFILGKIINQGNCSEEYKFLASFIKGLPNEFKDGHVRVVEGLKRQKGRDAEFGETSHRISVDDSLSEQEMITAFLHEMLHMLTSDVLKNPRTEKQKEIKRALEVLRQNVKSYYEQQLGFEITEDNIKKNLDDLRPYYGLINIDEFISELFTNKSFQRLLSNSAFSESKSFLQRIAELLRELIEDISGFKFNKDSNLVLDSAINNSLRLISDITSVPIGMNISENTLGSLSNSDNFIIKEGVKEIFEENKELANIGTQQQYSQYLDSLSKPNTNPILQDSQKPDVILPIGTSGSGKSTFIKSLPQENLVVIEPDAMRVEFTGNMNDKSKDKEIYIEAAKRAIKAIKQGKQVVFDTTNLTKDKRLPFIEAIKKEIPNANIQYKLMELNPELAKQRIKAQLERGENRANVSDETIDRHAASYKQMLEDIKSEPISNYDIQQEQVKKFAELQERLNNKEFLEGAKSVYEATPKLQQFGTQEEYNDYIARVSLGIIKNPSSGDYNYTSKVKDIVYHGTPFDFDNFKKPLDVRENIFNQHTLLKKEDNPDAIYFQFEPKPFRKGKVISAIINSKELIKKENYSGYSISYATGNRQKLEQQLNSKTFDALDITPIQGKRELLVFEPEQIHILGSKQDIKGFKEFVNKLSFDKELAQKIQDKLQRLYPEIKLNITNNPIWEKGDNVFNQEEYNNQVNYRLKATEILLSDKAKQVFDKGKKNNWSLDKILTELAIPKEQKQLLLDLGITDREQLALELASNYSYTVEINTAKMQDKSKTQDNIFTINNNNYELKYKPETGNKYFKNNQEISEDEFIKANNEYINSSPTQYYSNLTVNEDFYKNNPDWEYKEQRLTTPLIIPSIKGHAQFAENNDIGWFRAWYNKKTGEVHVLEVQSDLFQKGRDKSMLVKVSKSTEIPIDKFTYNDEFSDFKTTFVKKDGKWYDEDYQKYPLTEQVVVDGYNNFTSKSRDVLNQPSSNQFLQLLNKDNNWVTFFVKSIIQDSAKKGYEKVLFPRLDTIIQVESQNRFKTYAEAEAHYKNEKWKLEDEELRKTLKEYQEELEHRKIAKKDTKEIEQAIINQKERIRSHQPTLLNTANFYEYELANRLDDIVGGNKNNRAKGIWALNQITDEYGNTWNEVNINQVRDLAEVLLQRNEANQIIGQANIKAMTVLIDAINQKQDTLPHEYAHHYIAWFRNTPIVQEAIKKWGSEEALVQSIGEQVVKQKGEAYNWWNNFVKWIMNQFNSLSKLQKEELTQILTDAFLTRQDLGSKQDIEGFKEFVKNISENTKGSLSDRNLLQDHNDFDNIVLDYDGTLVDTNSAIQKELGITPKEYYFSDFKATEEQVKKVTLNSKLTSLGKELLNLVKSGKLNPNKIIIVTAGNNRYSHIKQLLGFDFTLINTQNQDIKDKYKLSGVVAKDKAKIIENIKGRNLFIDDNTTTSQYVKHTTKTIVRDVVKPKTGSSLKDSKKLLNEFQKDLLNRKNKLEESLHKEKNIKRKESLSKRIEVLKDQLTQLTNNNHYTTIVEIATENLAYVKQLMSKPNLTDSDIIEVQNFIALYKDTIKYLDDDFKFTNELDENGIITQYKTDIFNSFGEIENEAKRLDSKVFDIECDFLLNQYEKLFGTSITKEDLYKITKDVGDIENNFRSAGSFGVKLLEMQEVIIRLANNRANDKRTEIVKQNNTLFEKVKQNALFIEKGFSALLDKDENGKWNGKVLTKFNKKYWSTYYNIFKGTKSKKGLTELLNKKTRTDSENQQIEEHFDSYNNNHYIIDYTKLEDNKYKEEIIKRFGIVHGNNLLNQAETKYSKYLSDRQGYIDYLDSNFPNPEQRDKKLYDWEIYHSPIRLMQTLQGDRQLTSYGLLPKSYHWGYLTSTPLEQHFNEDYNVLEQPENVDLLNYLNFANDVLGDLRNLAPDKLFEKEGFTLNSLPIIAKDLMQKYAKDGMLSSFFSSTGDWLKSFIKHTQKENQKSKDEYTGKDSYNLELQGISKSSITEFNVSTGKHEVNRDKQSDNIFDILNYTAGTIALYQNKLDFEDSHKMIVRAMNHIGTEQYGHNANKDELKNVKSVADFYNKNYYGIANEVGGEVERKVYTKEENRKNKEINIRIQDITDLLNINLENKLDSKKGIEELGSKALILQQELELEDINTPLIKEKLALIKELNKLIEVKEGLGSNFSFGQTGRSILKWVQTKVMGFNLFSGINEVMFGMVTTFNYATGQEIYNEKDWGNAFGTMLRFRNGTEDVKKIHKLLEKFNLIKNSMVENIDSNPMNNTLFFLQKNAEAFTRGITMVSVLNSIKVKGVNGEELSLYNVLDSEGNIDKNLVSGDEYDKWTTGEITEWERLNIKIQTLVSSLHGNYDSDTPIKAKQSFWGMASLQFRTWLLEGIANRGQDEHFDSRLGLIVKGRYKTMNNSTAWIALLKRFAFISDKNNEELQSLSQVDKANIRKNATELIFLLTVSAAILALKHLGDDDEDDKEWTWTNLMLNNMLRLQQDLAFYINPNEVESLNSKIIPATVIMNDFAQLMDAYYDTVLGEGTYKTGMYSGDSKAFKETLQFFPVTNQYYKFDYLARQTMDKIK